jgi:hypothetical protein
VNGIENKRKTDRLKPGPDPSGARRRLGSRRGTLKTMSRFCPNASWDSATLKDIIESGLSDLTRMAERPPSIIADGRVAVAEPTAYLMGMIVRMMVMVRMSFTVSSCYCLGRRENESPGLDSLGADQVVGEVADLLGGATQ